MKLHYMIDWIQEVHNMLCTQCVLIRACALIGSKWYNSLLDLQAGKVEEKHYSGMNNS